MDDWKTFAMLWGPAVPMFGVLVFYMHRLIFVEVPHGFRSLRRGINRQGMNAQRYHDEAMVLLRSLKKDFEEMRPARTRRKKPQPKKPD